MTVSLVVGGAWWVQHHGPTDPAGARPDARGAGAPSAPGPRRATPTEPVPTGGAAVNTPPPQPLPRSRATLLAVPSLGIEAPVIGLDLDRKRRLTTPPVDDPELIGWYEGGASPGESGTAVAVGHRDTRSGAAVFISLHKLRPGRTVEARRVDGRTAVYTVDTVKTYAKTRFPSKEVYGTRNRPELRLITCGGRYDRKAGYASNIVVFAHLTAVKRPTDIA